MLKLRILVQLNHLALPKASGNEPGYPPSNAIDNNLNTRWTNLGLGSWIQVYAGSGKVICSVDIAWYRGNFRHVDFVIYCMESNYPEMGQCIFRYK